MEWISVKDRLPVIPKGKYGVTVLVAEFDPVFEEINPGNGYSVTTALYGSTSDRDGKKKRMFKGYELDFDFQDLYIGKEWGEYGTTGDEVTHWMYLPEPPERSEV